MKRHLGVAVGQMNSVDDIDANFRQIMKLLDQITEHDEIDLVCFPENSLYMRVKEGEKIQGLDLEHEVFSKLKSEAKRRGLYLHLGSVAIRKAGGLTNASVLVTPLGQHSITYEKIHLFDIDIEGHAPVRESDVYQGGEAPKILEIEGWHLGQTICYDLRFSELFSWYAQHATEALLVPSSFLVPTGKVHWHILLRARAIESQAYVIAAAQAGQHQSVKGSYVRETFGHSLVVDPWGQIIAEGAPESVQLLKVKLDIEKLQAVRKQIPMAGHRRLVKMKK